MNKIKDNFRIVKKLILLQFKFPILLILTIIPNIINPIIAPAKAWVTKNIFNQVSKGDMVFETKDLIYYISIVIGIFFLMAILKIWDAIANRMLDDRLFIELQRIWFDSKDGECPGENVAKAMNDCENARKTMDIFQKEFWTVSIGIPSVIIWQLKLGSEWLPALFLTVVPPFLVTLFFGKYIQKSSIKVLKSVTVIGKAVAKNDRNMLVDEQENYYKSRLKFELYKKFSELSVDSLKWISLLVVVILSSTGIFKVLPDTISAAQIGVFLVNMDLLAKPFNEMTKVYNKFNESWPSVRRLIK